MELEKLINDMPEKNNVTTWHGLQTTTEENTFMEQVESLTIFQVADIIKAYWPPILVPLGLVGNTLSFLVMMKPSNRKMSTCIYMAAISINDNLIMVTGLYQFIDENTEWHQSHPFECSFWYFAALYALQNTTFLILGMTTDKYIAIKWPHKAAILCTPRRARFVVVCLSVGCCLYNIPHLFLSGEVGGIFGPMPVNTPVVQVYSWVTFVINSVIPFTLLIHMNYVIVKTVKSSRKMFICDNSNTGMESGKKT